MCLLEYKNLIILPVGALKSAGAIPHYPVGSLAGQVGQLPAFSGLTFSRLGFPVCQPNHGLWVCLHVSTASTAKEWLDYPNKTF